MPRLSFDHLKAAMFGKLAFSLAIAFSIVVHGVLLSVRFISPDSFRLPPADPALEVVLVNAKHGKRPSKADALAQANLDGGGNAESGRSKSPLPDSGRVTDGEALRQAKRQVEQLQQQQQSMLAQLRGEAPYRASQSRSAAVREPTREPGADAFDSASVLQRRAAELAKTIEEQNKRPKKTYITPSTRGVGYAQYYDSLRRKIERAGTINFPQQSGRKLYGELTLHIPLFQDGTIYEKEGGIQVARSSGVPGLDEAAIRIVKFNAPYGPFPANMRSTGTTDLWVVTTRFIFTRDQALETQMQQAN
jgi:protein TonB